jgi:site-specific DNA-adenine methylase
MKNHFIMPYFGNKRTEVENLYNLVKDKLNVITTIVEPFCGSAAFSFYISTLFPKKYKYILNDNSNYLIELYKILKDEIKTNDFIKKMNIIHKNIFSKESTELKKKEYDELKKIDNIYHWFYYNKVFSIRPQLFPIKEQERFIKYDFNYILECPIINFLRSEDITFVHGCGVECFKKYGDSQNNFIFLDPPYLQLDNDFYQNKNVNIYEFLNNRSIDTYNAFIILILEDIWIIRLLFKNSNIIQTNNKTYQTTKKKTQHLTISNNYNITI